jgi:hypothetical protein
MPQVVIANRLTDGRIVFLADGDAWVSSVDEARVEEPGDGAEALLAAGQRLEAQQQVVGAELIDVDVADGHVRPTKYREAIRAAGPTNRPDLGKQAGNE